MAESSLKEQKTLLVKDKLLVTSNFSFPHSVFKRLILQTRKNQGLFGKGFNSKNKMSIKKKICILQMLQDRDNLRFTY